MSARPAVLVVEDNATLRRLLEYRLGKRFDVRSAMHGEHALQLIEQEPPDLIVSDIMMPHMDGFALLAALRSDARFQAIPFIFLTAKNDDLSRQKGLRKGVDDYLTKPFDIDHLIGRVDQIVQRSQLYQTKLNSRIGRDFSDKLLPRQMPVVDGWRATFFTQPKEDGGGDLFDWAPAGDGAYLITVGDIMGKGLQAKFYAFSFLSYIRSTIHAMLHSTVSPAALMKRVNEMLINDQVLEETFASLLLMRWEPANNRVIYTNAGHCRPILVGPTTAGMVEQSDLILGLDPTTEYTDYALEVPPDHALLCYTDGLNEQVARTGRMFGEAGVAEAARQAQMEDQPIKSLLSWMLQRSQNPKFEDDVLVFWLQRMAATAAKAA
ncbi:MAG TPA: fused response regulator/phosphatase [Bacteroidetes bacterium]|nr:fused response regulator/phosphatase [Bacteroidota bacterium]HIL58924.1 fused response regulator/phosphatase [Rhodothermales bacterium]